MLGIKEMRISLNLSHRIVSKGHFTSFGLRFTESFNPRQRVWATLTKKKMINQGVYLYCTYVFIFVYLIASVHTCLFFVYLIASVPKGTYSLCMDRKRPTGNFYINNFILSVTYCLFQRNSSTGENNLLLSILDVRIGVIC